MTRRQERRRRLRDWALIVAAGVLLALVAHRAARFGDALALVPVAVALSIAHRRMIAEPGVPILTYHSVGPDPAWLPWSREISVHPSTFERHLATLAAMRCTVIDTAELVALRRAGRAPPADAVALHFDDGYLDNWLHAAPALARHAMPATFFASLDFVAPDAPVRRPGDADQGYMSWAELAALDRDPLFAVEPHGVDHGRVAVSERIVDRLTPANWRRLAWVQWAATPGPKHDWFRMPAPIAVPNPHSPLPHRGSPAARARHSRYSRRGSPIISAAAGAISRTASAARPCCSAGPRMRSVPTGGGSPRRSAIARPPPGAGATPRPSRRISCRASMPAIVRWASAGCPPRRCGCAPASGSGRAITIGIRWSRR